MFFYKKIFQTKNFSRILLPLRSIQRAAENELEQPDRMRFVSDSRPSFLRPAARPKKASTTSGASSERSDRRLSSAPNR